MLLYAYDKAEKFAICSSTINFWTWRFKIYEKYGRVNGRSRLSISTDHDVNLVRCTFKANQLRWQPDQLLAAKTLMVARALWRINNRDISYALSTQCESLTERYIQLRLALCICWLNPSPASAPRCCCSSSFLRAFASLFFLFFNAAFDGSSVNTT